MTAKIERYDPRRYMLVPESKELQKRPEWERLAFTAQVWSLAGLERVALIYLDGALQEKAGTK